MIYLVTFVLFFLLSFPYVIDICSGYLNYIGFDLQEFLLWHYASINGIVPFKDIFYPYGLVNYFKNLNFLYTLIYYLISPILFTIIFFLYKKVFIEKIILYISISILYLFIIFLLGFQTFARYGLLVVSSMFFSYIFYFHKKIKMSILFYLSIVLGLLFSFINDIGFYITLSFFFLYLFNSFFQRKKKNFLKEIIVLSLGFIIGTSPLIVFLLYEDSFSSFLSYFKDIGGIVTVAKTPFFTFINSPSNTFTILIVYFGLLYNFIKLFLLKQKINLTSFFQISLIFDILVLEQKSIVRSIDRQIVLISFILLTFLIYELLTLFKIKELNKKIIFIFFVLLTLITYGLKVEKKVTNLSLFDKNLNLTFNNKCFENNLSFFSLKDSSYIKIINFLKKQNNFNEKVFSFPTGDSAFYVLLNQKPPYYNAIFEGASYDKQNLTIKYIQNNKIEYTILNTNRSSLQDGVPDYIRQNLLFGYILKNYDPLSIINHHLILIKKSNSDIFNSSILKEIKDYKKYLLDVYLYKIPYSEGLYKYSYLKNNNKLIIESNDADSINTFFKKNKFFSSNKAIVLIPKINYKPQNLSFVKFQIEDGNSTTVYYNSCKKNKACIIDLSKIPLFYKKRLIAKIFLEKEYKGRVEIFDLRNMGNLW